MAGIFSKLFHKQTNFNYPIGTPPSNSQYWPKEWIEIYHKSYPRMSKVKLSEKFLPLDNLETALKKRHATREFDVSAKLSFEELSTLIYYSAGVRPTTKNIDPAYVRRFYPSGGARYPLEVYLVIQRVENINLGIYHYNVKDNLLENIGGKEWLEELLPALYYPWSREAAVIYIISAVWDRNFIKYKDRGYRIVLMEAGHLGQNVALIAAALNIGCCNSVGFHNEKVNEVLDIGRNKEEDSLYMAVLGKPLNKSTKQSKDFSDFIEPLT